MQKQLTTIAIPVASLFLFSCSGGSLAELSRYLDREQQHRSSRTRLYPW